MSPRDRLSLAGLVFALCALFPGVAQAAPLGDLVVTPGESRDAAPVRIATSAGCPKAADGYVATMRGAGLPAEGLVIVANSDVGLSHDHAFEVPVALTFKDFAADNNVTFSGKYELALSCIDSFTQQDHGGFTGTLDFVEPARYVALGPAKGPQRPTAPLVVPVDPPAPGGEQATPPASGNPAPPASGDPAPPAEQEQPAQPQAAAPVQTGGGQPLLYIAIGVVGAVAVIAAGSFLRRRRSTD
ncbi:hypothetical protein ABZ816_29055 [Actinosynnema sp. NPDC047251]|uniref:Secreted protein n=1 Tax=Saccharothrix espanaensis (strain ATCC 51144 / DSM 44229 / JCM 9112 / NBRC 15066 / NRRL 15764) TaxID=1179773 RepID=K0JRM4_SACES|nr:hypothetical protein [Saccharothrix espanaensis]CCH28436.1 hypothetical protein BN6_11100 [Saccharothrix espanaensis DSM 44229]